MTVVIGASKSTTTAEALRTDALYDILRSLETPSSTLSSYIGVRYSNGDQGVTEVLLVTNLLSSEASP